MKPNAKHQCNCRACYLRELREALEGSLLWARLIGVYVDKTFARINAVTIQREAA